jgi:ABC-type multidrug transport system ATPase subunit
MAAEAPFLVADQLTRAYGATIALDHVDLVACQGNVLAVLGPNGCGKTTTVRIFATLLSADSGRAFVGGHDVAADAAAVRALIGLAGQYVAVDPFLTGRENLELVAELRHLPRGEYRRDVQRLLERLGLTGAAGRLVRTYSGGMCRRLDLAAALIGRPPMLFLDEPTTGLDPGSRRELWDLIGEQAAAGATVLLTTQYMEEADSLADRVAVLDCGQVIATGTPSELKAKVGGDHLELTVPDPNDRKAARELLGARAEPAGATEPVGGRHQMPGICVGIDGSDHSIHALEWASKEAAIRHVPLTVLTVHSAAANGWTGHPIALPQGPAEQEKLRQATEELTLKVTSQLGEAQPVSVTVRAVIGFPAQELIEASRDSDLLVVGSRGAGGFAKLITGSVSSQVAHHAHCPVVVVR